MRHLDHAQADEQAADAHRDRDQQANLPPLPVETIARFVGDGAAKLIERVLAPGEAGRDSAPLLARFMTHYANHLCVSTRLFPGVINLLDALSRAEIVAAVLSNEPIALAHRLVEDLAIAHRFVAVIGDGDGFPRKPASHAHARGRGMSYSFIRLQKVRRGIPSSSAARV